MFPCSLSLFDISHNAFEELIVTADLSIKTNVGDLKPYSLFKEIVSSNITPFRVHTALAFESRTLLLAYFIQEASQRGARMLLQGTGSNLDSSRPMNLHTSMSQALLIVPCTSSVENVSSTCSSASNILHSHY